MSERETDDDPFKVAHTALDRMYRASRRGTGCYMTADMIEALSRTFLGSVWSEPPGEEHRPRVVTPSPIKEE